MRKKKCDNVSRRQGNDRAEYAFIFFLLFLFCLSRPVSAQYSPKEIKYSVIDFYALRYYPFKVKADSIVRQVIAKNDSTRSLSTPAVYKKTAVHLVSNTEFLNSRINSSNVADNLIYKYMITPYKSWLQYAAPLKEDTRETALIIGLYEEYRNDSVVLESKSEGIYEFIGKQNAAGFLDETFGNIDLFGDENEALLLPFKSPLTQKGFHSYHYFLSAKKTLNGQPVHEVAFYPENPHDKHAFAGYLYITADGNEALVKALFTLNDPYNVNFTKNILFSQTFENKENKSVPLKKESVFTLGDEMMGSLLVNRTIHYTKPVDSLTVSEKQMENVLEIASQTPSFRNLKTGIHLLLTDHLTVGGEKGLFEYGPVSQSISYNETEGLRLKASGNTTFQFNKKFLFGGYLAYGWKDKRFKYRGDVIYSFLPKKENRWEFPKRQLQLTYVQDLNIPGDDLLTSNRDYFLYSFSHWGGYDMTFQKLAAVHYEHELPNRLSFRIGGKYLHDQPEGSWSDIEPFTRSEVNFSLRYAPQELFLQNREDRLYFRKEIELTLSHRIGLKGIFGSKYNYHITNFDAYRRFHFPHRVGTADVRLSAGKIWNRLPFLLLFIPAGNQSYVFNENGYNGMDYDEFITDNFVAGNVNFRFNRSPFQLFYKSKIKTNLGIRAIYGPLSDKNNSDRRLGNVPYVETNIGFSNIFKILRVEWVHRLTYRENGASGKKKNKGSIFVTAHFGF